MGNPIQSMLSFPRRLPGHVWLGLLLGAGFGLWNLIETRLNPLAEDTPKALLEFYGPMFAIWGIAGFMATRRTGRIWDGLKTGTTVAFITFVVFDVAVFVRVNLFLDALSHRSDWQYLVSKFKTSGFESFRAYANYVGLTGAPFKILVASIIGTFMGLLGGLFACLGRRQQPSHITSRLG
jgi:hypothetical protein